MYLLWELKGHPRSSPSNPCSRWWAVSEALNFVLARAAGFDTHQWYQQLFDFGMGHDPAAADPDDPDANLVPQLVQARLLLSALLGLLNLSSLALLALSQLLCCCLEGDLRKRFHWELWGIGGSCQLCRRMCENWQLSWLISSAFKGLPPFLCLIYLKCGCCLKLGSWMLPLARCAGSANTYHAFA